MSLVILFILAMMMPMGSADFNSNVDIVWGKDGNAWISPDGKQLQLKLDKTSGAGFISKNSFIFGRFEVMMKLVPGFSAGTVTTFYLTSDGQNQDEVDFEFLGNTQGNLYVLHTNVFTSGLGRRERRFHLWFDPTTDFHSYTILWNPQQIILYVDGTPIRAFQRGNGGVPYLDKKPLKIHASLWNGEDWATDGGKIKIDWSKAPFVASYQGYNDANACVWIRDGLPTACGNNSSVWMNQGLRNEDIMQIQQVKKRFMIYDYCADPTQFNKAECSRDL